MDLEKISQNSDSPHKQATGNKKKKKSTGKQVPLNFNDEDSGNQDELAQQHRETYTQNTGGKFSGSLFRTAQIVLHLEASYIQRSN